MEYLVLYLKNLWQLFGMVSVYLAFGLLVAGFIKFLLPLDFIKKQLGGSKVSNIFKAAFIGIPLPLCSCSVLPFASMLRKNGADKSSINTFLISTPITGVDSLLATYSALGWFFAIYRLITSFFISIFAGFLSFKFDNEIEFQNEEEVSKTQGGNFIKNSFNYAFFEIYKDIIKPLFIGLILAALISSFLPEDISQLLGSNLFLSYILVILIAMPLYVCATSSIPIGVSLIVAGFSPGAAFVFLTAGPAANLMSISVIKKILGLKSMWIYIFSVVFCTFISAFILDAFFSEQITNITQMKFSEESLDLLDNLASFFLIIMAILNYLPKKKEACSCGGSCH